ncbi:hypothetical protein A2867_04800 [Candidatus Daviesbacteria bacterium RIFCSPHIGHO2_01_FULL_40_11]|uniref:DUF5671 domain-containing protein n=1 Tax=Candidatus Daviesbacteria bacterium RIFCSPHIGHO2_01_FULL_40_11 TaxID=1797762 RepID=A0A1F5JI75_9BACT|nr:MAG: hypothetical protein A2867_04800 [Candidatus Daviesbacteria bacterium RIFCSPHIGHO2_01_FULL_40_11]OGE62934.1 MAG: hypothetical protein A2964_00295 [Candidatus Daviesbacteria bacterium RIFCSPLOWO2_01_FULL_40_27]
MNKPKLIISSAYAATVTVIFVVVITIWAELSVPLKDWLKNFSGHHWTSKSLLSVLMFAAATLILYVLPYQHSDDRLRKTLGLLLMFAILGTIITTLFFTGHHFRLF